MITTGTNNTFVYHDSLLKTDFTHKSVNVLDSMDTEIQPLIKVTDTVLTDGKYNTDISGNYRFTENEDEIYKKTVVGGKGEIVYMPCLTKDSPELESIYPFVKEIYFTNKDGERINEIEGGQDIYVNAVFNRDMDTDIQPEAFVYGKKNLSVSPLEYNDRTDVSGEWISPREWQGLLNIPESKTNLTRYAVVQNAAPVGDKWLLSFCPDEMFSFKITATAQAHSITLYGEAEKGANKLTWTPEKSDLTVGYNVYRGSNPKGNSFKKINDTLIDKDTPIFEDKDILANTKYYYYYRSVDTDHGQSDMSNIVEITALEDGKKFVYGDVDCDGDITSSDAATLFRKVLVSTFEMPIQKETEDWMKYSDVDTDGVIAVEDAAAVMQKTLVKTFPLPCEE